MLVRLTDKHPFCDMVKREVHNVGRNINILITGKTQMRKSTTALYIAKAIDSNFDIEKDMAIGNAERYLEVLKQPVYRGKVRILDEAGVGTNHRQWFTFLNQAMSFLVQTYGYKGMVVIVVAPFSDLIDKDIRKFFDYTIEIMGRDDSRKNVIAKVMQVNYNQDLGKIYRKHLHGKDSNGKYYKLIRFRFGWPPKEDLEKYFELANRYKSELGMSLDSQAKKIKERQKKTMWSPEAEAEKIVKDVEMFKKRYGSREYLDLGLIMSRLGIGRDRAKQVRAEAERKMGM